MRHLFIEENWSRGKKGERMFRIFFPSGKKTITKNLFRTLNKIGHLFYFTPEFLKKRGLINNLEMVELIGYRKRYGKIKACLLELK